MLIVYFSLQCSQNCSAPALEQFDTKIKFLSFPFLFATDKESDMSALELSKKRTALAGFCKLIAFNMIDMKLVAPVLSFLLKV